MSQARTASTNSLYDCIMSSQFMFSGVLTSMLANIYFLSYSYLCTSELEGIFKNCILKRQQRFRFTGVVLRSKQNCQILNGELCRLWSFCEPKLSGNKLLKRRV